MPTVSHATPKEIISVIFVCLIVNSIAKDNVLLVGLTILIVHRAMLQAKTNVMFV